MLYFPGDWITAAYAGSLVSIGPSGVMLSGFVIEFFVHAPPVGYLAHQ